MNPSVYPKTEYKTRRRDFLAFAGDDFHFFEGYWVVADAEAFAASGGDVSQQHFSGPDIGVGFLEAFVGHIGSEIAEDGGTVVGIGVVGIVDEKVFDEDLFGQVAGVAEVVQGGVASADQVGADGPAVGGDEATVADD